MRKHKHGDEYLKYLTYSCTLKKYGLLYFFTDFNKRLNEFIETNHKRNFSENLRLAIKEIT